MSARAWRSLRRRCPGGPLELAVFRVAVVANLLLAPELRDALVWSRSPAALGMPLTSDLLAKMGADAGVVAALYAAVWVVGPLALVGLWTRASCFALAVLSLLLLAVPQRAGIVTHTHHLVWFLALLAVGPSGARLSVDALLRSRAARERRERLREAPADPATTLTLAAVWALIGVIFFFPGAWKLVASDGAWLDGSALRGQLQWKWFEMGGFAPWMRVDRSQWLCRLGGLATLVFELSFVWLVFVPRWRWLAVSAALVFHALTAAFMRVYFSSLWTCYVVFVDWELVARSVRAAFVAHSERPLRVAGLRLVRSPKQRAWPVVVVALALIVPSSIMGALGRTQGWPFACYPTFHRRPPALAPTLAIDAIDATGRAVVVPHGPELAGPRRQRAWGLVWSLLGTDGRGVDPARLEAYARSALADPRAASAAQGAVRLVVYRAWYATDPDAPGLVGDREVLLDLPLGAAPR